MIVLIYCCCKRSFMIGWSIDHLSPPTKKAPFQPANHTHKHARTHLTTNQTKWSGWATSSGREWAC